MLRLTCRLRCPRSLILFHFYSDEKLFRNTNRDHVPLDTIEFIQNTLTDEAPTHSIGPIKIQRKQGRL
jgi:hypothetical protein